MDRNTWLREMRRDCEEKYDTRWAPLYGEKWGLYSNTTHQEFLQEFLSLVPQNSMILDAACGAGRYIPFLLEKKHTVIGTDQSGGMLANAKAKFPGVQFEKEGLQEMGYQSKFDGVICMDAIENVSPEDWPLVLNNFHRALKPQGYLYFTVETIENTDENEIKEAFDEAQEAGLPVVYGERMDEDVYHYHPTNQQVQEMVRQAGFEIFKEGNGEMWYYHILVRKGRVT
jgi:ubiquinone/menaquinone biosynthesis C-methylase UbiE